MGNSLEFYECVAECYTKPEDAQNIEVGLGTEWATHNSWQSEASREHVLARPRIIASQVSVWQHNKSEVEAACLKTHPGSRELVSAACGDNAALVLEVFSKETVQIAKMQQALSLACGHGSVNVVRELVSIGLDVNCSGDTSGMKPLHLAACGGHVAICEFLLDALADPTCQIEGRTAVDFARTLGHDDTVQAIEKHVGSLLKLAPNDAGPANKSSMPVLPRVSPIITQKILKSKLTKVASIEKGIIKSEESKSTAESDDEGSFHTDFERISNHSPGFALETKNSEVAELQHVENPESVPKHQACKHAQSGQLPSKAAPEAESEVETETASETEAEADAEIEAEPAKAMSADEGKKSSDKGVVAEGIVGEDVRRRTLMQQSWENAPPDVPGLQE